MSEFSRIRAIREGVGRIEGGLAFGIDATPDECNAVARRLELLSLDSLTASGHIQRGPRVSVYIVQGELRAKVVQSCVVTFDPVVSELVVPFERYFTSEVEPGDTEVVVGIEDEEPDPFDGEQLDVGEMVVEELSLALDPYPRAPGADAVLSHLIPQADDDEGDGSPFAKLQALKRRGGN